MRLFYSLFLMFLSLSVTAQQRSAARKPAAAKPAVAAKPQEVVPAPEAPLPQSVQMLDAHYGFRDVKLEADSANVRGLQFDRRDNDMFYYHRDTDTLAYGSAALGSITYLFYRGKLLSVSFTSKGAANSHAVLERLQAQYGAGVQKSPQQPQYTWRGEKTLLKYDESTTSNNAVINFISLPLTAKRQVDAADAAQKTASNR
jgi:hypothetical protein